MNVTAVPRTVTFTHSSFHDGNVKGEASSRCNDVPRSSGSAMHRFCKLQPAGPPRCNVCNGAALRAFMHARFLARGTTRGKGTERPRIFAVLEYNQLKNIVATSVTYIEEKVPAGGVG